jgi:hypothetical protein
VPCLTAGGRAPGNATFQSLVMNNMVHIFYVLINIYDHCIVLREASRRCQGRASGDCQRTIRRLHFLQADAPMLAGELSPIRVVAKLKYSKENSWASKLVARGAVMVFNLFVASNSTCAYTFNILGLHLA